MPFELPDNLHPNCGPVAWLLGTWRGNGHGDYPTIETFEFGQELIFTHDGRPFFHYMSRAWIVDADGEFKSATPPSRPASCAAVRGARSSFVLAHNTGFAEIWYGAADAGKVELHDRRGGAHRDRQGGRPPARGCTATSRATCSTPTTWRPSARRSSRTSGRGSSGRERPMIDDPGAAPGQRLPADPAAGADPGRGRRASGHATPDEVLAEVRDAGQRGQRVDGLPHPRGARGARPGPAHPPQRPGADVPPVTEPRALPPRLPELPAGPVG